MLDDALLQPLYIPWVERTLTQTNLLKYRKDTDVLAVYGLFQHLAHSQRRNIVVFSPDFLDRILNTRRKVRGKGGRLAYYLQRLEYRIAEPPRKRRHVSQCRKGCVFAHTRVQHRHVLVRLSPEQIGLYRHHVFLRDKHMAIRYDSLNQLPRLGWTDSPADVELLERLARRHRKGVYHYRFARRHAVAKTREGRQECRRLQRMLTNLHFDPRSWTSKGLDNQHLRGILAGLEQEMGEASLWQHNKHFFTLFAMPLILCEKLGINGDVARLWATMPSDLTRNEPADREGRHSSDSNDDGERRQTRNELADREGRHSGSERISFNGRDGTATSLALRFVGWQFDAIHNVSLPEVKKQIGDYLASLDELVRRGVVNTAYFDSRDSSQEPAVGDRRHCSETPIASDAFRQRVATAKSRAVFERLHVRIDAAPTWRDDWAKMMPLPALTPEEAEIDNLFDQLSVVFWDFQRRGFSAKEFYAMTGENPTTVRRFLTGQRQPGPEIRTRLRQFVEKAMEDLTL